MEGVGTVTPIVSLGVRLGMGPRKMLSGLKLLNPLEIESTLQSVLRMGYLALECLAQLHGLE